MFEAFHEPSCVSIEIRLFTCAEVGATPHVDDRYHDRVHESHYKFIVAAHKLHDIERFGKKTKLHCLFTTLQNQKTGIRAGCYKCRAHIP